ncbi:UNVERIFIED_ORG: pyruvate/2-oxoglutarate dehydrogenase complex dihydrolipoamide acyltransferase (E2) component [Arthrobacter sp. UYEF10]
MVRTKRIALGLTATALALGAGIGVAGMASATSTPTPTPSASSSASTDGSTSAAPADGKGMRGGHGHGGFRGVDAAELATKLGVDEAKVTEALKAYRDANKPTTPPADGTNTEGTRPDPAAKQAELAKSLAATLGIDEAKVTAALEELRSAEQADRAAALKTRLDAAVTNGKLTQAEADAVTKAVQNGVIGGGGR